MLFSVFILGLTTGLRAFTPLAVLCWAAYYGWIPLGDTPLAFLSSLVAAILVTLLALGELANDKRPSTGNRTAPGPFIGRVLLAALCGAAVSFATKQTSIIGSLVAVFGAILGTYSGFLLRRALVRGAYLPAFPVALAEDVIAIGGALIAVHLY